MTERFQLKLGFHWKQKLGIKATMINKAFVKIYNYMRIEN